MSQSHGEATDPFKSPVAPSPVISPQGDEECKAEMKGWNSHAPGNRRFPHAEVTVLSGEMGKGSREALLVQTKAPHAEQCSSIIITIIFQLSVFQFKIH